MELTLQGMQWERAMLYLDDDIVFGESFQSATQNLEEDVGGPHTDAISIKQ